MSTGYGWEGLRQVCATLLGARHVPERLCGGIVYLGHYNNSGGARGDPDGGATFPDRGAQFSGVFRMWERAGRCLGDGSPPVGSRGKAPVGGLEDDVPQKLKLICLFDVFGRTK